MVKCCGLSTSLLAIVIFATITQASKADTGLTGPARNNFVESSFQSCFREARGDPRNNATDVAIIAQYCVCFSNLMADQLANDDLKSLDEAVKADSAGLKAKMESVVKATAATCAAKSRK
jgi:hypothetical protein